jgi:predicted AlkP superfamily pyrophosphatase or phosphodiesterase
MRTFSHRLIILLALLLVSCSPQQPVQQTEPLPAPTSLTSPIPSVLPAPGDDFSTQADKTTTLLPTLISAIPPTAIAPKRPSAVVIVWDAGQAKMVYQLMEDGLLPHFSQLARQGKRAEYAQSIDPTLSAPAQAVLVTGSTPSHTGIVSNAFHHPSDNFYWYRLGFDEPFDQAEPVWVSASRAGLTTAALFVAGATPELPSQMADYTIGYGIRDAYSSQETVSLVPSNDWQNTPATYSPLLEGSFHVPEVARMDLLILDTTDDGQVNYDLVLLNSSASGDNHAVTQATLPLEQGEWGPLTILPNITAGADFLIQEIGPNQVRLYHSAVNHNTAAPRSMLEAINQRFGFFPAAPDAYALEHGWITAEDYLEMLKRSSQWMAEVSAWVFDTYSPNLLITWQDGFDAAGHTFLLTDPRQANFSPALSEQYNRYINRAVEIADRALETILEPIDLGKTSVFLTADHGIAPVHTNVYVNTLLERAGLLKLDRRNYVDVKRSKALAVTSGGSVNIYINLQGRDKDGILPPKEYPEIQAQIVELLRSVKDPETGQPVFTRVLARQELSKLNLDHPNAGDVFAQAALGYNLDDWRGKGTLFGPATIYGGHGYDSALPEMQTLFIAAGAGISPTEDMISPLKIIDIAPTLAALLDFEPSDTMEGSPILAVVQP